MIRSTGRVVAVDIPSAGWYQVELSQSPDLIVPGTAVKKNSFVVGEEVVVIQYGGWNSQINEFGFVKLPQTTEEAKEALPGVVQIIDSAFGFVSRNSPANVAVAYISNAVQKYKNNFFPATIIGFAGNFLRVVFDYSSDTSSHIVDVNPFERTFTRTDFSIGDRVILTADYTYLCIYGWWQTVPQIGLESDYYILYPSETLRQQTLSNVSWALYKLDNFSNRLSAPVFNDIGAEFGFQKKQAKVFAFNTNSTTRLFDINGNALTPEINTPGYIYDFFFSRFPTAIYADEGNSFWVFSIGLQSISNPSLINRVKNIIIFNNDSFESVSTFGIIEKPFLLSYRSASDHYGYSTGVYDASAYVYSIDSQGAKTIVYFENFPYQKLLVCGVQLFELGVSFPSFYVLLLNESGSQKNELGFNISIFDTYSATWYNYDLPDNKENIIVYGNFQPISNGKWKDVIIVAITSNYDTVFFVAFNKETKTFRLINSVSTNDFQNFGTDFTFKIKSLDGDGHLDA